MRIGIYKFKSVTSTNDIAINLIKKDNKQKGCVYADTQTKGRGTRGKKWLSQKGNLFLTIFFNLKKNYPTFSEFSIINPVIISNVIQNYCEKKIISFKFPNDVFLNKKKVCGILQELITFNRKKFLIIGIGINIVSSPNVKTKYRTTSIYAETRKNPQIKELIKLIISSYERFFFNLNTYNFTNFRKEVEIMAFK